MTQKWKERLKNFFIAVLVEIIAAAIILGGISLGKQLSNKADKDGLIEVTTTFAIGIIDEDGRYSDNVGGLYTKDAFECKGLKVTLEFGNFITYRVFFYNSNGDYITSTDYDTENMTFEVSEEITHARIVIVPNWELLGIYEPNERAIKWYEVLKYSSQIKIYVLEDQEQKEESSTNGNEEQVTNSFEQISLSNDAYFQRIEWEYFNYGMTVDIDSIGYDTYILNCFAPIEFYLENNGKYILFAIVREGISESDAYQICRGNREWETEQWFAQNADTPLMLKPGDTLYITILREEFGLTQFFVRYK